MATPFRTSRRVEFSDTDMAGIMHFAAYFRYMEAAEHEFLRSLGFGVYSEIDGANITFPRVAAKCDYHSPIRFEQLLDIDVTVVRVGTKSVTYGFLLTHEGRKVASGELTSVCCQVEHGQSPVSIAIPTEIAARLRGLAAP